MAQDDLRGGKNSPFFRDASEAQKKIKTVDRECSIT